MTADESKQIDLVAFLERHYELSFRRQGAQWVALSPFSAEQHPSFVVRCRQGHWLFKDFSSDLGGSIIDFVMHKEEVPTPSEALGFLNRIMGTSYRAPVLVRSPEPSYDLEAVQTIIAANDPEPAIAYLRQRGISEQLTAKLEQLRIVRVNRVEDTVFCCFEVRNESGELCCLDNHQIGGSGKFVLGTKTIFTLDHERLKRAEQVFIVEGIIDCLSLHEIEGHDTAVAALLGVAPLLLPEHVPEARQLIAAMDDDDAGLGAIVDLQAQFPDKHVRGYELEGHKDPNELLQTIRSKKRTSLPPERKLQLYEEYVRSDRKSEVAERWGVDRSYMYEIVRDCKQFIQDGYTHRKPGRKPAGMPVSLEEAWERIRQVEREAFQAEHEKEVYYVRSELMAVRLKYAEQEAAELRGERSEASNSDASATVKKKQIKKKRKTRR